MIKRIFLLIGILLLITSFSFAETIKTKSGKIIEGKIIERTDEYIKIDIGIGMPITYFLDEIENIDSTTPTKTTTILAQKQPNAYVNEEFGVSVTGPTGWHMEKLDLLKLNEDNMKRYDLVKFYKNYNEFGAPIIVIQLFEAELREDYPGLENFIKDMILSKSGVIVLEKSGPIEVNGKKYIQYLIEKPGYEFELVSFLAYFESQRENALVICQVVGAMKKEDLETTRPLVEDTINSLILK